MLVLEHETGPCQWCGNRSAHHVWEPDPEYDPDVDPDEVLFFCDLECLVAWL